MPKEMLPIARFGLGMVTSIDPQDVPLESAIYSENLDNNALGRLQGILVNSLKSSTVGENAIGINNWLRRETGEYDLIYTDGTDVRSIRNFYGTPTENQEIASKVPTSMVRMNRTMHMGTGSDFDTLPQFLGWGGDFRRFGGMGTVYFSGTGGDVTMAGWEVWGLYSGDVDTQLEIEITDITYTTPPGVYDAHLRWTIDGGDTWHIKNGFVNGETITLSEGMYTRINDISYLQIGFTLAIDLHIKSVISMIKGDAQLVTYEEGTNTREPNTAKFSFYDMAYVGLLLVSGDSINSAWDKRITAANVYRAEDATGIIVINIA